MINRAKFKENFKDYDNGVVVLVMDIFLGEYEERLESLQKCINELDFETLHIKAHSLKGVVAYMSPELSEISRVLEFKGREKDSSGLQNTFDNLKTGILDLVVDLRELRSEYEEEG